MHNAAHDKVLRDTIDVRGLPKPIAHVLQTMVEALRQQLSPDGAPRPKVTLPAKPGTVLRSLSRSTIYRDVG
jgi:hypothetical protein